MCNIVLHDGDDMQEVDDAALVDQDNGNLTSTDDLATSVTNGVPASTIPSVQAEVTPDGEGPNNTPGSGGGNGLSPPPKKRGLRLSA